MKLQLQTRKLTPEAFYRICDVHQKREIQIAVFKLGLKNLGLLLSEAQQARLVSVLDEDLSGQIS